MRLKELFKSLIPGYAVMPLLAMVLLNSITYFGTRLVTTGLVHYDLSCQLDKQIPFCAFFIVFYIGAYLQWAFGFIRAGMESKDFCYRIILGECIAKLICLCFFLLLPTTIDRPDLSGNDLFCLAVRKLYEIDAPDNLFPSIHCLESYICLRAALGMKKAKRKEKLFHVIMTIGVFLSTIFLKQHVVMDMLGAVTVAELGLTLGDRILLELKKVKRREVLL